MAREQRGFVWKQTGAHRQLANKAGSATQQKNVSRRRPADAQTDAHVKHAPRVSPPKVTREPETSSDDRDE